MMRNFIGRPDLAPWLLAPVLVAVLLAVFTRLRARLLARLVDPALLPRLAGSVDGGRRRLRAVLLVASILAIALAMVRPRFGAARETVRRSGVDILFAVDLSRSMLADDVKPNRLTRVLHEVRHFVEATLVDDRVGLVAFAGVSFVQCPLTHDYGAFRLFLDDMDPRLMPRGGTAVEEALYRAMESFGDDVRNHKAIVLFTDGEDTTGSPERAAEEARQRNIRIFTVGVGSPEGALIPVVDEQGNRTWVKDDQGQVVKSRLDETTLQKIALETGGAYKRLVGGQETLGELYERIRRIERKSLESEREERRVDRFQWFAAAGLAFLAVQWWLPASRRRPEGGGRG